MESYKECAAKDCQSNSIANANKIFICFPYDVERRKNWFAAVNTSFTKAAKYLCEDHFNLEEDVENWQYYKMMGGRLLIKKDILPKLDVIKNDEIVERAKRRKVLLEIDNMSEIKPNKSIQVSTSTQTRNKITQTVCYTKHMGTNTDKTQTKFIIEETSSPSSMSQPSTSSEFEPATDQEDEKKNVLEIHSRFYLGVPSEQYYIIKMASETVKTEVKNILIVLKKIRLNDQYKRLSHDFNVSETFISRAMKNAVPLLAKFFVSCIVWPSAECIKRELPRSFRLNYRDVQSIIDCFEIQIEKPSIPSNQASTWSNYKKCNTVKYLISCLPNGLVNFISHGFLGRTSDTVIFKKSGYLDELPEKSDVLADRGFKHIAHLLLSKQCNLIRPPSTEVDRILTNEETLESKRIAAVRIHIERVIGRLRDFKILEPNVRLQHNLLQYLDDFVIISCGLINLHGPLIK